MSKELATRPLATIADELRDEVEQAEQHWQSAVQHAIRAGELLIEAKGQVKHGEWLPWLEVNFRYSERHARRFMQLAQNRTRVADLPTIREAVAAIESRSEDLDQSPDSDFDSVDVREARWRRVAHEVTVERWRTEGREPTGHLFHAEFNIRLAEIARAEGKSAAASLGTELAAKHVVDDPEYAAVCAEMAAAALAPSEGPWEDDRFVEAVEAWQIARAGRD